MADVDGRVSNVRLADCAQTVPVAIPVIPYFGLPALFGTFGLEPETLGLTPLNG